MDRVIDKLQKDTFENKLYRVWNNESVEIKLPEPNVDVIFIFSHILQHFLNGGIGLRQICDWCRLLWTYRDTIDNVLLLKRLKEARILSEWQSFADLAVDYLGMPKEAMPFSSQEKKWKYKANRILDLIIKSGNLGQNRDLFYKNNPFIIYKLFSFMRHTKDCINYIRIFPVDSFKIWWSIFCWGIKGVIKK